MTGKSKYWLAVEDGQTVRFADLAHMIAHALHPTDDELDSYAAALINLDEELKQAVKEGALFVRNPAGLGRHTFPVGDALRRAVLIPNIDLEPFLSARGIELRITPYGSGPHYWTIENAATAMQEQEGWHNGTRAEFQDHLQDAASKGSLVVLDPRTCLPTLSKEVRTFYELVTPANLNAWLGSQGAPYRWNLHPAEEVPQRLVIEEALQSSALESEATPDRGRRVKRAALIEDNLRRWPTIERDLKDAAENGLSKAARDITGIGWWWEGSAIAWARARAKVRDAAPGLAGMPSVFHRTRD